VPTAAAIGSRRADRYCLTAMPDFRRWHGKELRTEARCSRNPVGKVFLELFLATRV